MIYCVGTLAPNVGVASVLRVNGTAFNITLSLLYTGAGPTASLRLISAKYRSSSEGGVTPWKSLLESITLERDSSVSNVWYAVVVRSEFAALEEVEFQFSVQNNVISTAGSLMTVVGESGADTNPPYK